jgi:tetratricopeptide (TPR) repeat protein
MAGVFFRQILALALLSLVSSGDQAAAGQPGAGGLRYESANIAEIHRTADRLYAEFKPREAAAELQRILRLDGRNFEALVKLARAHIDIGDSITEDGADWRERKFKEYSVAEGYARKAVRVDPNSTWGYFWIAAALGNIAVVSPVSKQVDLAGRIRDAVEKSLALDPQNGPAYHIYGVWHRKVAEIGGAQRAFASVLFGRSLPQGSLEKSVEYLQKAVALNPAVIVSRLELAQSYLATENSEAARAMLQSIPDLPIQFSDDAKHKRKAAELLEEIKSR